jgi:hypothetical protein
MPRESRADRRRRDTRGRRLLDDVTVMVLAALVVRAPRLSVARASERIEPAGTRSS